MKCNVKRDKLKRFLLENNMSAIDFSKDANISYSSSVGILSGRTNPGSSIRKKLVNYFDKRGLNKEDLFEIVETESDE